MSSSSNPPWKKRIQSRREFLKHSALAGVGAGIGTGLLPMLAATDAAASIPPGEVRRYSALGKTGLKISDISFGGSRLQPGDEDIVRHAFDRGINYFDSADSYGDSETVIGNALKGKRDKVYLTSKTMAGASDSKESMMTALEGSLKLLQTDHVDVYFNHAINDVERIKNPQWHEFNALAKRQGKIRFAGMSGHAGNLIECLDWGIDSGRVDVILCAYNFGQDPSFYQRFTHNFDFVAIQTDLPRVITKAKAKGVGVIAMKTLRGARLNDMRPYEKDGATFSQAAFRWVLANQNVDALIVSMTSAGQIDEYLGASGARATAAADIPLLRRYEYLNASSQCRQGCGQCESSCPYGVEIGEVLRTRMYAVDYEDLRFAREEYALLGKGAEACLTCSAKPCATACVYGLRPDALLAPTHRALIRA
jgi:predicted aldo/keto reductase-like oxidoreductase